MDVTAQAGIDIYGTVLRYAEVARRGTRYTLRRLGSCEFDFDIVETVLQGSSPDHVETLSDALIDVFEGSLATRLQVVIHPPHCYSFFSPLPVDMPTDNGRQRLLRDATLLTRSSNPESLRLTADPVYTETLAEGNTVEWFHVLALKEALQARFDRIFRLLPHSNHRMTLSMQAIANAVERLERQGPNGAPRKAPFTLALGWYPTHVEYTLCRHSHWYFSHFTDASSPNDSAYFGLALLNRIGLTPADIGHVFVYGEDVSDFTALEDIFEVDPEHLNPANLIDIDPNSMMAQFDADAYVPCLSVTL